MARPEIKKMLDKIRQAVGETSQACSEKEVLEELVVEADGWNMRLEEIEAEEKDTE